MKPLLPLVLALICILSCSSPVPNDSNDSSLNSLVRINQPPTILSLTVDQDTVSIADSVRFTCRAEDPDGDSLNYEWLAVKTKDDGSVDVTYTYYLGFDTTAFIPTENEAVWISPRWPGTYKVFCKVMDSANEEVAEAPILVSTTNSMYFLTDKYRYRINEPITRTVGNKKYPGFILFSGSLVDRFENNSWQCVGSTWWFFELEYGKIVTATDYRGIGEPGLYRLRYAYGFPFQDTWTDSFSNAFVVE